MKVEEVMTRKVITIKENQSRQQAARLLTQNRISGLPVVNDDNVLVGVITEFDVIGKEGKTVRDLMTRSVISVSPDTDVEEASHILVHERIRRLPVLDQGKVVGIISRADFVRMVAMHWICPVCGEVTHSESQPLRCFRCDAEEVFASSEPVSPGS